MTVYGTTLYEAVIGYYLAAKPLDDLQIEFVEPDIKFLLDKFPVGVGKVAAVLLAIKIAQLAEKAEIYYFQCARKELIRNWQAQIDTFVESLQAQKVLLNGINFELADPRIILENAEILANDKALIAYDVPATKGLNSKTFKNIASHIIWNEPTVNEVTPEEAATLLNPDSKATILLHTTAKEDNDFIADVYSDKWHKVYAGEHGDTITRVLVNKPVPDDLKTASKAYGKFMKAPYPLYNEAEITKKTQVAAVPLRREIGEYYRDLFIHRLGAASADNVFGILLDGHLFAIAGFKTDSLYGVGGSANAAEAKKNYIFNIYGMTVPSKTYKRLSRLFMYLMTSQDFKRDFCKYINIGINDLEEVRTVGLTFKPVVKANHGLLKIIHKEKQPDGSWYLVYQGPFHERSYKEAIVLWVDENRREEQRKQGDSNE
jgi:hypothetical protein